MKLRLSVQNGSLAGREFELEQSALVLGRGKDCNLRFDYDLDPGVSSRHATIRAEQDGFYVVDEQSTNGTLLNGSFIQKSLLHSGDTIQLSSHGPRIRVQIEGMDTVRATQVFARLPQSASPEAGPKPAVASAPAQQPASRDASLMETFSGLTTYNPTKQKDNTRMLGCVAALVDRGLLAPFSHALFTSMTGIGCGVSRETHNKMLRVLAPAVGYVMAMILHGFWNAIASAVGGVGYYIAYLMVWVPLFLIFLAGVLFVAKRERDIIKKMLVAEVADGLITQQQLDVIGSLSKRMAWLLSSSGDMRKLNARRRFLRAVTKLAFSYWHVESAEKEGSRTISLPRIPRFQAEVKDLQDQI